MVVQHNMSAMNANRMLGITTNSLSKSTEKLSSGYRINRAADDAAGLAISEKMRGQIRGLNKASSNAQDGISMIQTAEGALTETHSILQRMRELAVQASNDTTTDDDRTQIQNEIDQLTQEVDRIANTTEFNTKKLLDGSKKGGVSEKAGSIKTDSSFKNSYVSATVTTDGSAKSGITDVIRLEINTDFTEGQSTKGQQKLSDDMMSKINAMVTTTGNVDLDEVSPSAGKVTIATTGVTTGTGAKSTEENIKQAKEAVQDKLTEIKNNGTTASQSVEKNNKAIEETAKNIYDLTSGHKTTDGKKTFLRDGVTQEDLVKAITAYKDALVENGTLGTSGTLTSDAAGSSDAITKAKNDLKALFDTDTTSTEAITALANTDTITAAGVKSDASAIAATKAGTEATVKDAADMIVGKLDTFVKSVAGAEIANNIYSAQAEQVQGVLDTLNNTELTTAIVDYNTALTEQKNAANGSDDKKAEAQAKVDAAKANLDKLNTSSSPISVTDLFGGSDASNFTIASKLDDNNNLTINIKNKSGDDTVITITNANQLKSGDTLTITSQAMVESEQAAAGKDALRLQIGANSGQEMYLGINSMKASDLNIVQNKEGKEGDALEVTKQSSAAMAINAYDMAIQKVSTERAKMGAVQNRLEHTIQNLDTAAENTQTAESRIRDTDMAAEMVNYSSSNILSQAGQSMLAQAKNSTQGILSLLQ